MKTERIKNLAKELEEKGVVRFIHDDEVVEVWETEQGEDNIRGEEYMNYMIKFSNVEDYYIHGNESIELGGGLCTGTPIDAITFMMEV